MDIEDREWEEEEEEVCVTEEEKEELGEVVALSSRIILEMAGDKGVGKRGCEDEEEEEKDEEEEGEGDGGCCCCWLGKWRRCC